MATKCIDTTDQTVINSQNPLSGNLVDSNGELTRLGADQFTANYAANIINDIETIKNNDVLAGIAINPDTDFKDIIKYLDILDYVLVMTVFPGFGGQKFIEKTLYTIKELCSFKVDKNFIIGVDGGVNMNTIDKVYQAGADITIVGSALFGADNISEQFKLLLNE